MFVAVVIENFDAILVSGALIVRMPPPASRFVRAHMSPPARRLARARMPPPAGRRIRVHRASEPFLLLAQKKFSKVSSLVYLHS